MHIVGVQVFRCTNNITRQLMSFFSLYNLPTQQNMTTFAFVGIVMV